MTDQLNLLWEERQIEKVMLHFGRALDVGDWPAYRACFTDVVNIDFKRLTGFDEVRVSADLWTRFARLIQTPVRRHHAYSNFQAEVKCAFAHAIVYFAARVWRSTDLGGSHYVQYGWYEVDFTRNGNSWCIARLRHDFQWVEGNMAVFDMSDPELMQVMQELFSAEHVAAANSWTPLSAEI